MIPAIGVTDLNVKYLNLLIIDNLLKEIKLLHPLTRFRMKVREKLFFILYKIKLNRYGYKFAHYVAYT